MKNPMILTYLLRSWVRESTWPVRGGGANVHGGWLGWLSTLNGHFTPVCICSQPNIRPIAGVNYTETLKFTAKAFMVVLAQPTAKLVLSYLTDTNYETDSTRAQSALTPMWYKLHSNCNSIPQSISSWDIANISMTRQTVLPRKAIPSMAGLMVVRMQCGCKWIQLRSRRWGRFTRLQRHTIVYRWGYTGALDAAEARKGFASQHSLPTLKSLRIDHRDTCRCVVCAVCAVP